MVHISHNPAGCMVTTGESHMFTNFQRINSLIFLILKLNLTVLVQDISSLMSCQFIWMCSGCVTLRLLRQNCHIYSTDVMTRRYQKMEPSCNKSVKSNLNLVISFFYTYRAQTKLTHWTAAPWSPGRETDQAHVRMSCDAVCLSQPRGPALSLSPNKD